MPSKASSSIRDTTISAIMGVPNNNKMFIIDEAAQKRYAEVEAAMHHLGLADRDPESRMKSESQESIQGFARNL